MRAISYAAILMALILAIGCEKVLDDDFGGDKLLRGRLTYLDRFASSNIELPLANRTVRLAISPSDSVNFKYSVTTDKDGYFLFDRLNGATEYELFFADTVRHQPYLAIRRGLPQDVPFILRATNDLRAQNVLRVDLHDPNGGLMANTAVCLFNNRLLARTDTCVNSVLQLKTDAYGQLIRYGLRPGKYYLLSKIAIAGQNYRAFDSVSVGTIGLDSLVLTLNPYTRRRNGFELTLLDTRNTPLTGAQVCLFSSAVLARVDTCVGSIRQINTDANGRANAYNLDPRRYYFRIRGQYGKLILKGYDSLDVQPAGVASKTIQLK